MLWEDWKITGDWRIKKKGNSAENIVKYNINQIKLGEESSIRERLRKLKECNASMAYRTLRFNTAFKWPPQ